jgi:hypothetical protein
MSLLIKNKFGMRGTETCPFCNKTFKRLKSHKCPLAGNRRIGELDAEELETARNPDTPPAENPNLPPTENSDTHPASQPSFVDHLSSFFHDILNTVSIIHDNSSENEVIEGHTDSTGASEANTSTTTSGNTQTPPETDPLSAPTEQPIESSEYISLPNDWTAFNDFVAQQLEISSLTNNIDNIDTDEGAKLIESFIINCLRDFSNIVPPPNQRPPKPVPQQPARQSWTPSSLRKLITKRNNLSKQIKRCKTNNGRKILREEKKAILCEIRRFKKQQMRRDQIRTRTKRNKKFKINPWKFVKSLLDGSIDNTPIRPSCSIEDTATYWSNRYTDPHPDHVYSTPHWLPEPSVPFPGIEVPKISDKTFRSVLNQKSPSSAPGPDKIPYTLYKNCPALHPIIIALFNKILDSGDFPKTWKHGTISMIHKQGLSSDPANFRPICLTNSIGKLFTSILAKFTQKHMTKNKLFNTSQKGFMEGISGCVEHQFSLQSMIDKCKRIGRSDLVVVMTDLADAFGSVKHSLILFALRHYKFHPSFQHLIENMYTDLQITFKDDNESRTVAQGRGVFQGDPLSPVLFNIVINLILEPLCTKEILPLGATVNENTRCTSLTFADDVTLVARSPETMKDLLYIFERGLTWSMCLTPAPHKFKCRRYYKDEAGSFTVSDPDLSFRNTKIMAAINEDMQFKMLGKIFPLSGNTEDSKAILSKRVSDILDKIDRSETDNKFKLEIARSYVHSFLRWDLTIYDVPSSWVNTNLTTTLTKFIKKWSGLAKCANIDFLYIPKNKGGLGFLDLTSLHQKCQINRAHILECSKDPWIKSLWEWQKSRPRQGNQGWNFIKEFKKLCERALTQDPCWSDKPWKIQRNKLSKLVQEDQTEKRRQSMLANETQGRALKAAIELEGSYEWMPHFLKLNETELKFALNSLADTLPTPQRLFQWGVKDYRSGRRLISDTCTLCNKECGTLGHILGSCEVALGEEGGRRYTWRHDRILHELVDRVKQVHNANNHWTISNDLPAAANPVSQALQPFNTTLRPDLVGINESTKKVIIMELTVPMETQIDRWHTTKTEKYRSLVEKMQEEGYEVSFFAVEVGCRGLIPPSCVAFLKHTGLKKKELGKFAAKLSQLAVQSSWKIFQCRSSKLWGETQ